MLDRLLHHANVLKCIATRRSSVRVCRIEAPTRPGFAWTVAACSRDLRAPRRRGEQPVAALAFLTEGIDGRTAFAFPQQGQRLNDDPSRRVC
jgi:hypothetical protein